MKEKSFALFVFTLIRFHLVPISSEIDWSGRKSVIQIISFLSVFHKWFFYITVHKWTKESLINIWVFIKWLWTFFMKTSLLRIKEWSLLMKSHIKDCVEIQKSSAQIVPLSLFILQRSQSHTEGFDGWSHFTGERPKWAKGTSSLPMDASIRPGPTQPILKPTTSSSTAALNKTRTNSPPTSRRTGRSPTRTARDPPSK